MLTSERERYDKYRTTLTDLTHSLKTPLAVLQAPLRSLRGEKIDLNEAEPIMLEQISRIRSKSATTCIAPVCALAVPLLSRELQFPIAPR